ncbi:MAG: winged helix-turn-helix transcriptional regulator [Myxococcales bacterium]|nr:winged helix-turn-helix transcriptional regulator [Myxococcales bacterium]
MATRRRQEKARAEAAALAAAFAHPLRLEILQRLLSGPCCVGDVVCECGAEQPTISRNLGLLLEAGLVTKEADGKRRVYTIAQRDRVLRVLGALGLEPEAG